MIGIFKRMALQTSLVEFDKQKNPFKKMLKLMLEVDFINYKCGLKPTIDAYIDTGFTGGIRLPIEYEGNLRFSNIIYSEDGLPNKMTFTREGKQEDKSYILYDACLRIYNQNNIPIDVYSGFVIYKGMGYALIGMDFLYQCGSLFTLDIPNSKFSFSTHEGIQGKKWSFPRWKCRRAHDVFPTPIKM